MAESRSYDVMIVDRMLPQRDGLSVISALREANVTTPAIILSALGQVDDRVTGLRAGGDDYLAKPFAFSELLARVEILGRRRGGKEVETSYKVGDLELDRLSHEVRRSGKPVVLQPREFRLLEYLMKNANQVVTAHHAPGECLGLSFRPADQRHRRSHLAAALEDRARVRIGPAAHRPWIGLYHARRYEVTA